MERYTINITKDKEAYNFEVADFPHHTHQRCRFEVYRDGEFVAGFEPDDHEYLRLCKNTGMVDEQILYVLADELEKGAQIPIHKQ